MAGRPETPIDPDDGPVARLAHDLRVLRAAAGSPTYRDMARTGECGASTLSGAAAGKTLPTLAVVLAYAKACGGDPAEWEERWQAADAEAGAEPADPATADAAPPYRGLRRYEPDDRALFFGRESVAGRLADRVREHRLMALVGPSGSGKSSLLRAGLIPLLREERDPARRPAAVRILTPGPDPLAVLSRAMTPAPGDGDTVVIVDQFEEIFTLCDDPVARTAFLDLVLTATATGSRLRLVLALRADYFGRCAEHRGLAESLRETTLLLGPMSPDELREAIVRPAASAGLIVERALTARIIREVGEERGALPLMSHALLETWRRRKGRALTEEMYEAAGGIHGAIAHTAEAVYGDLTRAEALAARRALLRLVNPGEDADVRRSAGRAELDTGSPDTELAVRRLADARLLTLDDDTVDLAHEALITAWPRYRSWIEEDREALRLHRRLTEAARAWDDLDRDPGALYRGVRLAAACDAFGPGDEALSPLEAAFLDAGRGARDADVLAAARTSGRLRTLTLTLSVLLVLALTAGIVSWRQTVASDDARHAAQSSERAALSSELSAQSGALLGSDPALAAQLAVAAYRESPGADAVGSLYAAVASPLRGEAAQDQGTDDVAAFSPDGRTVAIGYANAVALWNTVTGATHVISGGPSVSDLVFDSTGKTLTLCFGSGYVSVYDLRTGHLRKVFAKHRGNTALKALGPGGRTVVAQGLTPGLRVYDIATGKVARSLPDVPMSFDNAVVDRTGRLYAQADRYGTVRLWDLAADRTIATSKAVTGQDDFMPAFALSPDGRTLAVPTPRRTIELFDTRTGHRLRTLTGPDGVVTGLAFSPDSRTLAGAEEDRTVRLWDVSTGTVRRTLTGVAKDVTLLAYSPDGRTLLSAGGWEGFQLWNTDTGRALPAPPHGRSTSVAFSPDGRDLALSTGATVDLRDAATGRPATPAATGDGKRAWTATGATLSYGKPLPGTGLPDVYRGTAPAPAAFGPGGHPLVPLTGGGTLRLRDTVTGATRVLDHHAVTAALLGPDGHSVATVGADKAIRLTDTATGRSRTVSHAVFGNGLLAFSPDGRYLLSVGPYDQQQLRVCPTAGGVCRAVRLSAGTAIAVSPDDHTIALSDNGSVGLYDLRHPPATPVTGTLDAQLGSGTTVMAFSPDGRTLAVGDSGGTVRLWDVATRRVRATFSTGTVPVGSLAFSPDGHRLAAADVTGAGRIWTLALPDAAAAANLICHTDQRALTPQEKTLYLPHDLTGVLCPEPTV